MSVFGSIIGDFRSFASKVEAEFKKMFKEAPSWLAIAEGVLTYLGPIVVTIVDIAGGPALGTEAGAVLSDIKTKLATAAAMVKTAGSTTGIEGVLTEIQADLPVLLSALQVSNPTSVEKVTAYTEIVGTELAALLSSLSGSAAAAKVA
ncbi:MAG: hypothetical protein HIU91_01395 [Acidobacteria bacterium]|nr:hypothetical protein [Acidobacteriota bacterium]